MGQASARSSLSWGVCARIVELGQSPEVNWLLLPDDEALLVEYMSQELGLVQISGEGWNRDGLPGAHGEQPWEIVWWARDLGPILRMGDAPPPTDAHDRVLMHLNQEADPEGWRNLLDTRATPIITFHRSNWNENACLNPGRLGAMSIPVKQQPKELIRLLRRIERWLEADGEKVNPFRHTINTPVAEPERLGALTAWARPHALAWIREGGKVWPWHG